VYQLTVAAGPRGGVNRRRFAALASGFEGERAGRAGRTSMEKRCRCARQGGASWSWMKPRALGQP